MYRQLITYSKVLGSILALFGMMIFGGGSCFLQKVQDKIWDPTPPSSLSLPEGNLADTNKQENNTYAYSYEKTDIDNQDECSDESGYGNSGDDLKTTDNESGYETTEDYIENNSHTLAPNYDGYYYSHYYSNSSPTTLLPEKENASVIDLDLESDDQKKPNLEKKEETKDTGKKDGQENDESKKKESGEDEDHRDNRTSADENDKINEQDEIKAVSANSNLDIFRDGNNNDLNTMANGGTKDEKKDNEVDDNHLKIPLSN